VIKTHTLWITSFLSVAAMIDDRFTLVND